MITSLTEAELELKKENIKLRSLTRRAAEEIRDLDDHIIAIVNKIPEAGEIIGFDTDPLAPEGMASINLLNRLDRKIGGGYIENYDDLHLELKTLDGHYQFDHPSFYRENKEVDIKAAADKVIEDHKEALQKLADTPSAICDACGKRTYEYETVSSETLSGVVMCSGNEKKNCRSTKWYDCAHCDAGYVDQECTCDNNCEGEE
jgi:hypothetical protein